MEEFTLIGKVTCSIFTKVRANSLEEAVAIAEDRGIELGGINSGADEQEDWILDCADGEPFEIHEE